MKYEEFAFFNQQLAAMVRDGIPLEGAVQRLCGEMRHGPLRAELTKLGDDLAKGRPFARSRATPTTARTLPPDAQVGAQTNDLPGVLTMLADHYQRRQALWTRLKGLMVYPAIVLVAALLLSCFLSIHDRAGYRQMFQSTWFWQPNIAGLGVARLVRARSFWRWQPPDAFWP